jgi:hypothetical protein
MPTAPNCSDEREKTWVWSYNSDEPGKAHSSPTHHETSRRSGAPLTFPRPPLDPEHEGEGATRYPMELEEAVRFRVRSVHFADLKNTAKGASSC